MTHSRTPHKDKSDCYFIPAGEAFSPACFVMPFFSCANFAGLFSFQLLTFVCRTPRILVFFAGITQLYRTCGKIATYQYAPQEISQFWRFSPPSHSIVPPLPAFGRFRERHGQLPGGAGPYPQPITPPGPPTQFPVLTRSLCDPRVTFSYLRGLDLVCRKIPAAATVSASVHVGDICLT